MACTGVLEAEQECSLIAEDMQWEQRWLEAQLNQEMGPGQREALFEEWGIPASGKQRKHRLVAALFSPHTLQCALAMLWGWRRLKNSWLSVRHYQRVGASVSYVDTPLTSDPMQLPQPLSSTKHD